MNAQPVRLWHGTQLLLAEALHQRIAWLVAGVAVAVIISGSALRGFNFGGEEPRFLINTGRLALGLTGTLLAALLGPVLFFDGLATGTTHALLVRGLRRFEVLAAQLLALWAVLGWLFIACAIAVVLVLVGCGHAAHAGEAVRSLASGSGSLFILGGVAVLGCAIARGPLFAGMVVIAVAIAGQLAPVISHAQSRSAGFGAWGWGALDWIVPNFAVFTTASPAAAAVYAVGYSALYAFAGMLVFSRREI